MTNTEPYPMVQLRRLARQASISSSPIKNTVQAERSEGLYPGYSASGQDVWLTPDQATFNGNGIVISAVGARCGKSFLATGRWGVTANTAVLFPRKNVSAKFLWYIVNNENFWIKGQTAQPYVQLGPSLALPIPSPSPERQLQIAEFLDRETAKIDALIDKQEQLIATLREDRAATIHDTVTTNRVDPSRQALPLKRISRILDCKHITAEFTSDGIPLASIREVQGRYVNLHTAKRTTEHFFRLLTSGGRLPRQGDLIFSRNATVGQVAEVQAMNEPFAMGQDVCLIRPDRSLVHAGFLWYSLRSDSVLCQLDLMMIGSTFKRINVEEVKNILIDVPSLEEQGLILQFLDERISKIDSLIARSTAMIETLREYRSALITNAVTGKIDVREAV